MMLQCIMITCPINQCHNHMGIGVGPTRSSALFLRQARRSSMVACLERAPACSCRSLYPTLLHDRHRFDWLSQSSPPGNSRSRQPRPLAHDSKLQRCVGTLSKQAVHPWAPLRRTFCTDRAHTCPHSPPHTTAARSVVAHFGQTNAAFASRPLLK